MIVELEVSPYQPRFKQDFIDLNLEWLEHFFYVEEHDREVLNQCEKYILQTGGKIFFFLIDQKVVGTYAFMKLKENVYEFTKMAVSPKYRGQGIGNKMMQQALEYAKENHFESIIIYSNRILQNAIHLYIKYGFEEITMEKDGPYQRGDIKLKLDL